MDRIWTDDRDGIEWTIEAIPMAQQLKPGERIPMIGETPYTIWLRASGESIRHVVTPDVGSRLSSMSESELAALLDKVRGLGTRVTRP